MLHADGVTVQPAVCRCGLHHGVLATHVVRRQRHVHDRPGLGDDVQVGQRRLHHHHVGALVDVSHDLDDRLTGVGWVLLVSPAIATAHDLDVDGVPERAVEGRGVLGGVRQDHRVQVPRIVQGAPDGRHLAVHHPGGSGHVRPGPGLGHGGPGVELEGGVVVHRAMAVQHAAMPVVGVLVDAEVGHEDHLVAHLVA